MVWPCKQNASGKASQTGFACESKNEAIKEMNIDLVFKKYVHFFSHFI